MGHSHMNNKLCMFIMYDIRMNKKLLPSNADLLPVTQLNGLGAIAARAMVEYFLEVEDSSLRGIQSAAIDVGREDFEQDISVPTVSRVARMLKQAKVFEGSKVGRVHHIRKGKNLQDFYDYLQKAEDYGTRLTGTVEDDAQRILAYKMLDERGAVKSTVENQIPKAAYKMLMQKFLVGEVDIAFIKRGLPAGVKYHGSTIKIEALDD